VGRAAYFTCTEGVPAGAAGAAEATATRAATTIDLACIAMLCVSKKL
jgi:hypothetical protein